jgi:DNA repair exonuclease SbcCD ATPase subunit
MKVTKLTVHNIGLIEHEEIEINKPLILFYGEVQQGKTTYLNAIRWVCGGSFPSDIIRHGQDEAFVQLDFDGGVIRREWYVAKDKTTKAREVTFIKGGRPVSSPVSEIKRLLNPFLLNQDHLRNMGEAERKAFFTETFAVDTSELDTEYFNLDTKAKNLRSKLSGYGKIDLTEVQLVDPEPLREQLKKINSDYQALVQKHTSRTTARQQCNDKIGELNDEIAELEKQMEAKKAKRTEVAKWLDDHPAISEPASPDTRELEAKIDSAAQSKARHEQYLKNKERAEERDKEDAQLKGFEARMRQIRTEKLAKLKTISANLPVKDLVFDESGGFTYQGTQAGMLSTSQVMQLSSELSALYPEGLGVELLDRGESLGKSIFNFIERAANERKSILATIVGEAPATFPEEVGVFVVEKGKAKAKAKKAQEPLAEDLGIIP